jgi:HSP20 family protein
MTTTLPSRLSQGLTSLRRADPFRALQEEVNDLLNRFSRDVDSDWLMRPFAPALDVSETEDAVQVRMDVPGIDAQDINIEVAGNTLRITGERKEEKEEKGETWHRIERRSGSFARSVPLPSTVKDDKAEAHYADGVLTVKIPKSEEAKTHKVKVKCNGK